MRVLVTKAAYAASTKPGQGAFGTVSFMRLSFQRTDRESGHALESGLRCEPPELAAAAKSILDRSGAFLANVEIDVQDFGKQSFKKVIDLDPDASTPKRFSCTHEGFLPVADAAAAAGALKTPPSVAPRQPQAV